MSWSFTWQEVLDARACAAGRDRWLESHPETTPETVLSVAEVLENNGLDDALWCLQQLVKGKDNELRLFAVTCARRVQHLLTDECSVMALGAAESFARGEGTAGDLAVWAAAAEAAAACAARGTSWAAEAAAWVAAEATACDTVWAASLNSARAAARAAGAAWNAEREYQTKLLKEMTK